MRKVRNLAGAALAAGLLMIGLTGTASAVPVVPPPHGRARTVPVLPAQWRGDLGVSGRHERLDVSWDSPAGLPLPRFRAQRCAAVVHLSAGGRRQLPVVNKNSHLCVAPDPGAGVVGMAFVEQQRCGATVGQQWQFVSVGNGDLEVVNTASAGKLCLSARRGSDIVDHDQTVLLPCIIVPDHQIWRT